MTLSSFNQQAVTLFLFTVVESERESEKEHTWKL